MDKRQVLNVLRRVFSVIDFLAFALIACVYIINCFVSSGSSEQYKILIGALGLTATLSGCSFRAASAAADPQRKAGFVGAGEKLFRAAIIFIVATVLRYTYAEVMAWELPGFAKNALLVLIGVPSLLMFFFGLYLALRSLMTVNELLSHFSESATKNKRDLP